MNTSGTEAALDQLAQAVNLIDSATAAFAADEPAAGHAAYFAWLVEQAGERLTRAQVHAAHGLRASGAHLLEPDSYQAIRQAGLQPSVEDLARTRGRKTTGRSYFKNTVDLYKGWLNLGVGVAQDRINMADALVAGITEAGQRTAPRFGRLGDELANPGTNPALVLTAARQLRKAEPDLGAGPQAGEACERLQEDAITLIRHEPGTARRHLPRLIEQSLGENRPLAALLGEAGLFRRGMRRGLMHYLLKVMPQDAELIESLCVQIDNPKTIAGNRDELKALVNEQYARPTPEPDSAEQPAGAQAPAPGSASLPPQWGEQDTMPDWARADDPSSTTDAAEQAPPTATPPTATPPTPDAYPAQAPGAGEDVGSFSQLGGTDKFPEELLKPFEDLRPEFRHLIALLSLLRADHSGTGKQVGVVQPEITVIMDYDKMVADGKDFAVTENGIPISAAAMRAMLCNGILRPAVFGTKSEILDIGRTNRLFPNYMRKGLRAKYRGCAYPGCTMPASRCEADHITPWDEGGQTSIDNGCLFCPMHHHARHCGLFTVIRNEDGPPMVLLPKDLDPHQRPRINTYWLSPSEALTAARAEQAAADRLAA